MGSARKGARTACVPEVQKPLLEPATKIGHEQRRQRIDRHEIAHGSSRCYGSEKTVRYARWRFNIWCQVARKRDLKKVDAVLKELKVTNQRLSLRFRDYIHQCKETGYCGTAGGGDHTMDELRELLREFLDHEGYES
jgi:hypothetical protein